MPLVPAARAAAYTWDGGGADNNWSTDANWSGDPAVDVATGDTLTFDGATRLTANNDLTGLVLGNTAGGATAALTFAPTAGAFTLTGNAFSIGNNDGNTVLVTQSGASDQIIANNITFAGGQRDRLIDFTAAGLGTITFSGNIHFSNDIIGLGRSISAATNAGTIVLSGNNTGDGKGNQIAGGGNTMRAMLWTPVDNARVVLGSDTALGNSGTGDVALGTGVLKGIVSSRALYISTTNGDRDLSGSTFGITGGRVEFDGADNLKIGNVINSGGNRDLWVTGAGKLTVTNGLFLSNDTTGRSFYFNVTGSGGAEVSGKIYDTFNNTGGVFGTMATQNTLRKAGAGVLTLSGDNTFAAIIQIEGGTLRLGHNNALGSAASTDFTSIRAGTLDLNGHTTAEKIWSDNASAVLANSSTTAASVTTDIGLSNNLTVNATGNITVTRLIATGSPRTVTKLGTGTLTTNGTSHNNLTAWDIQAGTVVFANTSGYAADRGVTLTGGTLRLSGANNDLINDGQAFVLGGGTFDLNGKSETIGALTLSASTTSTIDFGSGSSTLLISSITGTGLLNVLNWTEGSDSLRVTADASSVLGQITINGFAAVITNAGSYYEITASAIPEPSAFAALAGLGTLGFAATRRRRAA